MQGLYRAMYWTMILSGFVLAGLGSYDLVSGEKLHSATNFSHNVNNSTNR